MDLSLCGDVVLWVGSASGWRLIVDGRWSEAQKSIAEDLFGFRASGG